MTEISEIHRTIEHRVMCSKFLKKILIFLLFFSLKKDSDYILEDSPKKSHKNSLAEINSTFQNNNL